MLSKYSFNKYIFMGVTSTFDVGQTDYVMLVLYTGDWSLQSSSGGEMG